MSCAGALLHAIDRQQLADVFVSGRTPVAHIFIGTNEPEYKGIENAPIRYDYDPRRAAQLIEGLGYRKDADGSFRDAANQRLAFELRADPAETEQKSTLAVTDLWQQLGLSVDTVVIPTQRLPEREYIYTYPAFHLRGHSTRMRSALPNYHSKDAPRPENRWAGRSLSRYGHPELDAAIDRYFVTIPPAERAQVLQGVVRHITEQLPVLNLFYVPQFALVGSRVENTQTVGNVSKTWESQRWDIKS